MSDSIAVKKLGVGSTIKDGISIGMKNIGPIFVNSLLYLVTCWIPYINIGTTIGLSAGIVAKMSRGEAISYTEIFDPKYRKPMGDFFIATGLVCLGVTVGSMLFFIPGIILGLAWTLAVILVIDKGKNPMEALTISYNRTNGSKGAIFWVYFIVCVVVSVLSSVFATIGTNAALDGSAIVGGLMGLLVFLICVLTIVITIGIQASIYKQLASDV